MCERRRGRRKQGERSIERDRDQDREREGKIFIILISNNSLKVLENPENPDFAKKINIIELIFLINQYH